MKIALLTSGRLPVPAVCGGAVETKIDYCLDYNNARHLHDITVYSITPPQQTNKETACNHYVFFPLNSFRHRLGAKIYSFFNKKPYYDTRIDYFLFLCLRHLRKCHYDCILIANRPGYVLKVAKQTKTRIVAQLNNNYLNINSRFAEDIKKNCSLIITCSHYLNKEASEVKCEKAIPIITVHNGIDIQRFIDAFPVKRSVLNLSDNDFVIVYSGRLTEEKGIMQLIKAIKSIKDIPHLKLVIIGANFYGKNQETTPFMKKLEEEARPISSQVVFTGYLDYKIIPSYLKLADIAVIPSMWEEPFGLTVVEAMAAGLPLITTRSGGIPEICEGVATIIERDNIVPKLANAITDLYMHPEERKTMRNAAVKRSLDFTKERYAEDFFKALESVK